ncbi:MAG: nucleotidyl transferase AbiEii/AbiGii toxin family protein, partial [Elusimicrobiota bacterium]
TISREQHFAEKLHAYTVPRQTPNSRVRDLVDMLLLIGPDKLDRGNVLEALRATFERRKTHSLPTSLERPPEAWRGPFSKLASGCGLAADLDAAFGTVNAYFSALGS